LDLKEHLFNPDEYDVCIFSGPNIVLDKPMPAHAKFGIELGAPIQLLGFPHGLRNTHLGQGFPVPLV
jgi:hypothetical protein